MFRSRWPKKKREKHQPRGIESPLKVANLGGKGEGRRMHP